MEYFLMHYIKDHNNTLEEFAYKICLEKSTVWTKIATVVLQ